MRSARLSGRGRRPGRAHRRTPRHAPWRRRRSLRAPMTRRRRDGRSLSARPTVPPPVEPRRAVRGYRTTTRLDADTIRHDQCSQQLVVHCPDVHRAPVSSRRTTPCSGARARGIGDDEQHDRHLRNDAGERSRGGDGRAGRPLRVVEDHENGALRLLDDTVDDRSRRLPVGKVEPRRAGEPVLAAGVDDLTAVGDHDGGELGRQTGAARLDRPQEQPQLSRPGTGELHASRSRAISWSRPTRAFVSRRRATGTAGARRIDSSGSCSSTRRSSARSSGPGSRPNSSTSTRRACW